MTIDPNESDPTDIGGSDSARKKYHMTIEEVQERLAKIEAVSGDDEAAHGLQDGLYVAVLMAIAEGDTDDPAALAAEALKVKDIVFARWMA